MWLYVLLIPAALAVISIVFPSFWGGAWSPTPMKAVSSILDMAKMQQGEVLYDLGAGDGRVVLKATSQGPVRAVGVEIDPLKCLVLKALVRITGRSGSVDIIRGDFFRIDLREADVVVLYLSPAAYDRLKVKFERELKRGARVICYRTPMPGWNWNDTSPCNNIYLYRMGDITISDDFTMRESV